MPKAASAADVRTPDVKHPQFEIIDASPSKTKDPSEGSQSSPAASDVCTSSPTSCLDGENALLDKKIAPEERVSIYVLVFEEMLQTAMERESYLFNDEEKELLARFQEMSCKLRLSQTQSQILTKIGILVTASVSRFGTLSVCALVLTQEWLV